MDGLPLEIITNILSWLPGKSVMRCRSVCKTWCSLIDTPQFVKKHFDSSVKININPSSLIVLPSSYQVSLFIVEDYFDHEVEVSPAIKCSAIYVSCSRDDLSYFTEYAFVGSSHGLLCFSATNILPFPGTFSDSIYICNPATQESHLLPQAYPPDYVTSISTPSGFGFDHSTNTFKVVNIYYWKDSNHKVNSEVQVYTLGSSSWRKVNVQFPDGFNVLSRSVVCVSGSIHWISEGNLMRIVAFDLSLEDFVIVPNPDFDHTPNLSSGFNYTKFRIGALGGCLCLSDGCSRNDSFEIWVMNEYNVRQSWTKQYVIPKYFMDGVHVRAIQPVLVRKNGDLVLFCDSGFLVSYNLENGTAVALEDDQLPRYEDGYGLDKIIYDAFPYITSLISPKSICKLIATRRNFADYVKHSLILFLMLLSVLQAILVTFFCL